MANGPERPWEKGLHDGYAMFRLEVDVCVTEDQEVHSDQRPQDQVDVDTMSRLYSYGEQQAIFALLTEALRREAFFEILIRMSDDPKFLDLYLSQDEEGQKITEEEIAEDVIELFGRTVDKMTPSVVKTVLQMMDQRQKEPVSLRINNEENDDETIESEG